MERRVRKLGLPASSRTGQSARWSWGCCLWDGDPGSSPESASPPPVSLPGLPFWPRAALCVSGEVPATPPAEEVLSCCSPRMLLWAPGHSALTSLSPPRSLPPGGLSWILCSLLTHFSSPNCHGVSRMLPNSEGGSHHQRSPAVSALTRQDRALGTRLVAVSRLMAWLEAPLFLGANHGTPKGAAWCRPFSGDSSQVSSGRGKPALCRLPEVAHPLGLSGPSPSGCCFLWPRTQFLFLLR